MHEICMFMHKYDKWTPWDPMGPSWVGDHSSEETGGRVKTAWICLCDFVSGVNKTQVNYYRSHEHLSIVAPRVDHNAVGSI